MKRVQLIHWKAAEAKERAQRLEALGYEVESGVPAGRRFLKDLQQDPPLAVVIDLSRLPSQGRDMGIQIRKHGATRRVPLVFVEGDLAKVARIQDLLPDAAYTSWQDIGAALEKAIASAPQDPVVPDSAFAAYAGRPLPAKLGIKTNSTVVLVNAPEGFAQTLGELPAGAKLSRGASQPGDLAIWFTRSRDELEQGLETMVDLAQKAPLWIAWPKKASKVSSDLSQQFVRETGLSAGLVDYKICSIDDTWSGLLFTRRK